MALSKTIIGTTNNQYWTYKIVVTETATDTVNRTSTIKVEHYLGRKSNAGSSYFEGAYTIKSTINGTTKTSNKSMASGAIASGGWKNIGSHTFTVSNIENPTTITISSQQTSSIFTPSSSSASGTMDLTVLHLPPEITNIEVTEQNNSLTTLGIDNDTIVSNLSIKQFTITAIAYDEANLTTYNVYYNDVLIGTSQNNVVTCDFSDISIDNGGLIFEVIDDQLGKGYFDNIYPTILYTKPMLENTYIKRKSTGSGGIIAGDVTLTLNGSYYAEDDAIGNANTITNVEYKIWNTTEPSYTDITSQATIDGGSVTISGYDINGACDFDKTYNYQIVVTDYFGNQSAIISGSIPTGLAIWTEYEDCVDFIKLTINNQNILAPYVLYDNNEYKTDTDITLSDSSANYEYLEIFYNYYASSTDHYSSIRISDANGKVAMLTGMYDNGTYLYEEVANYTVNGTTITRTSGARWRIATGGGNSTRTNTTSSDPSIWVTKVIGYK